METAAIPGSDVVAAVDGEEHVLTSGESYTIPGDEAHAAVDAHRQRLLGVRDVRNLRGVDVLEWSSITELGTSFSVIFVAEDGDIWSASCHNDELWYVVPHINNTQVETVQLYSHMVDVILVRQDIEPGKTDRAAELFERIGELRQHEAVVEALEREGVYTESAFLDRTDDGDSVLYYIEAADGESVFDVYKDIVGDPHAEAEELVEFIEEFRDVVDGDPYVADVEFLYHLPSPTRP